MNEERPASEGGRYKSKRDGQAHPLHVSDWDIAVTNTHLGLRRGLEGGWSLNCSFILPIEEDMSGATPEPRTAVMILVEASWLDNSGTLRSLTARMENRSAHGACIRIKTRVGVGARLYIQSHREQFSGIAKYCRVDGKEYLVGIYKDAVNYPIPKNPMPPNVFTGQTHPQTNPQTARETGRMIDVVAEEPGETVIRSRAEPAGPAEASGTQTAPFRPRSGQGKASDTWKNKSAADRNSVPSRVSASRMAQEFSTQIEGPIAARLLEQDARQTESPPGEPPRNPPAAVANVPAAVANAAPQVQTGNRSENKAAKKGRSIMKLKWFAGDEEQMFGPNGARNAPNEPAQRAAEAAPRMERGSERAPERAVARAAAIPSGESAGGFEAELLPMEDIYRAAGITSPRRGYSIGKVVEMLRSEHLRGASRELRRAAVLMALDAAGVTVDEVLQDAKVRQEAIDAYATEQRKHAEAQWARKAEENIQIQAELELVKAHYGERIRRNLDGVAREKATFGSWLKAKEQETQGMAEAVEQVLKAPAPAEPPADPLLSVTVSSATGKPV
jgi:hypothetical protein